MCRISRLSQHYAEVPIIWCKDNVFTSNNQAHGAAMLPTNIQNFTIWTGYGHKLCIYKMPLSAV